jgi:hypothetical protein
MRARHRHLNFKDAGAVIHVDSRFISGLSNNDEVTSWSNRAAANDAGAISGVATPNYITGQLAGQPTVRFANLDVLRFASAPASFSAATIICTAKPISALSNDNNILYYGNSQDFAPNFNWVGVGKNFGSAKWVSGNYNNPTDRSVVSSANYDTTARIATGVTNDGGTNRLFLSGSSDGTAVSVAISINASALPIMGRRGGNNVGYLNADVYSVALLPDAVTPSQRKRLEHSSAYSFKISCN